MTALRIVRPDDDQPQPAPIHAGSTVSDLFQLFDRRAEDTGRYCARSRTARQVIVDRFLATFGQRHPASLLPHELDDFVYGQPGWRAASTRRWAFNICMAVFNWAARKGLLANPFAGADKPEEGKRRDAMRLHEFLALVRGASPRVRPILWFAAWSGCRPGEWAAATWRDVDLTRGCIILHAHKTAKKTGKPRIILLREGKPLKPGERRPYRKAALRLLRWLHSRRIDDGHIFRTQIGTAWQKNHWVQTMARLSERLGLRRLTWHMIRHMHATQEIAAGKPIKLVSQSLGHSSVVITERYYCHLEDEIEQMREMLE